MLSCYRFPIENVGPPISISISIDSKRVAAVHSASFLSSLLVLIHRIKCVKTLNHSTFPLTNFICTLTWIAQPAMNFSHTVTKTSDHFPIDTTKLASFDNNIGRLQVIVGISTPGHNLLVEAVCLQLVSIPGQNVVGVGFEIAESAAPFFRQMWLEDINPRLK